MPPIQITKIIIFNTFYSIQEKSRSGGGKLKSKMTRKNVPLKEISDLEKNIDNTNLLNYFNKLKDRKINLAPPPKPK